MRRRRQVVDRDDSRARRHVEWDGVGGGDRRLEVSSVDDLATYHGIVKLSTAQVSELFTIAPGPRCSWRVSKRTRPVCVSRAAASAKYAQTSAPVARS